MGTEKILVGRHDIIAHEENYLVPGHRSPEISRLSGAAVLDTHVAQRRNLQLQFCQHDRGMIGGAVVYYHPFYLESGGILVCFADNFFQEIGTIVSGHNDRDGQTTWGAFGIDATVNPVLMRYLVGHASTLPQWTEFRPAVPATGP